MALSEFSRKYFEKIMNDYLKRTRPPTHIRDELNIGYRIENQNIELFEIRPSFRNPSQKIEQAIAKATYVIRAGIWKIYWKRADLKWHKYEPVLEAVDFEGFLAIVDDDHYGCFHG